MQISFSKAFDKYFIKISVLFFRHRRKDAGEPECTPPPRPPKFTKQFLPLLKIMESEVFINLIKLILDRADNLRSRCFSEAQVHKALHMIGICLLEEDRQDQEPKVSEGSMINRFVLMKFYLHSKK